VVCICAALLLRWAGTYFVCCSVLQCIVVFDSVLQCVEEDPAHWYAFVLLPRWAGTRCIFRGFVAVCCSVLQCVAVCCSVLQCVAEDPAQWYAFAQRCFLDCRVHILCVAVCCTVLHVFECVALCCTLLLRLRNTLQHTATRCNVCATLLLRWASTHSVAVRRCLRQCVAEC